VSDPITIGVWNDDKGENDVVEVTKELVEKLKDSADLFAQVINNYIGARQKVDPEFKNVPRFEMGGSEDTSFDLEAFNLEKDEITVEWKEFGRCGDSDYFTRSFPFSDLWDPKWEARAKAEAETKAKAAAEKQAAAELARKKATEERERKQLQKLQAKYGGAP
jgi:hypothetical protein